MLFTSIDFAIFLPIVFLLYWFVTNKNLKLQNLLIVSASYLFYGWWDWRFLSLIIISSGVDYLVGLGLSKQENQKKRLLLLLTSIFCNLGFLGFFKYYNFFIESFAEAFSLFGHHIEPSRLNIILPVGISFYTFQTLSYTIDVYRRKFEPTKNVIAFFAFVSFFPQLVAGPIERAKNLLPQFYRKRQFDYAKAVDGMKQILWGLFKKIVIADNCATFVDDIFTNYSSYSGSTLLLGVVFFAFQIYADFSGYSDIAIGTARLFGFNLKKNFAFPYFSRDIAEFWRRWHISLTTWFRDYVYIPLGGSKGGTWMKVRNVFVIFLVSGFWHGDKWTFLAWGFINACFFLPLMLLKQNRKFTDTVAEGKMFPSIKEFTQMVITFFITLIAWVFFRAENIGHAINYLSGIFTPSLFTIPPLDSIGFTTNSTLIILIIIFMFIEWHGREQQYAIAHLGSKWKRPLRYAMYYSIINAIFWFGGKEQQFIYFQF